MMRKAATNCPKPLKMAGDIKKFVELQLVMLIFRGIPGASLDCNPTHDNSSISATIIAFNP